MRKGIIWLAVLVIVVLVLVFAFGGFTSGPTTNGSDNNVAPNDNLGEVGGGAVEDGSGARDGNNLEHTITMTNAGFSINELTVKAGDTVVFVNSGTRAIWPASDIHPTHRSYPGSGISKCGTSIENSIFDACSGVAPGGSYSFVFDEKGTWGYHDHLRTNLRGTIIVQ